MSEQESSVMEKSNGKADLALPVAPAAQSKPFDLASVRLSQDFNAMVAVKKEATSIPIRKADKQVWFCISPHPEHQLAVALLEVKDTREVFIVHPCVQEDLIGEWVPKRLVLCQTKQGDYFWWAVKLPDESGKLDDWNESATEIVATYAGRWVRLISNQPMSRYDVLVPLQSFSPPEWTTEPVHKLIEKSVKGKVIDSLDHPAVKKLKGAG